MKTLYYYILWLFKQYRFDWLHIALLGMILFVSGSFLATYGNMIIVKPDGHYGQIKDVDPIWSEVGIYLMLSSGAIYALMIFFVLVVAPLRKSFRRFREEQENIMGILSKRDKRNS